MCNYCVLLPIFALAGAADFQWNVQLSRPDAGRRIPCRLGVLLRNIFTLFCAQKCTWFPRRSFKAMATRYKLQPEWENKCQPVGLRNGRHKNRDNRLINFNTKVVCKHRKLILFVKQSATDYKQLANYEKMETESRSSTVKHSSSTKNCAGQKESRKRLAKWTKKCWPGGKQRFTGVGKKVYWVVG